VEIRVDPLVGLLVLDMIVATGGIGLPQFDHRIGHRRAVAVQHPALDDDPLAFRIMARHVGPFWAVEPECEKRPDRLPRGRCELGRHHVTSNGVASRPRSTMSNS
jgi:hypothetical protein